MPIAIDILLAANIVVLVPNVVLREIKSSTLYSVSRLADKKIAAWLTESELKWETESEIFRKASETLGNLKQ